MIRLEVRGVAVLVLDLEMFVPVSNHGALDDGLACSLLECGPDLDAVHEVLAPATAAPCASPTAALPSTATTAAPARVDGLVVEVDEGRALGLGDHGAARRHGVCSGVCG